MVAESVMDRTGRDEVCVLLDRHEVPYTLHEGMLLLLDSNPNNLTKLRDIGFRLGNGCEEFRYLLYYKGKRVGCVK